MKIASHPHWPKKDPETLPDLQEYLRSHFDFHFTNPETIAEIRKVLEWMKSGSSQVLNWDGAGSFCTLFTAFHTGAPFMKEMMDRYSFPKRLLEFLRVSTALESTTDQFAYLEKIEELQQKEKIIASLQRFLDELPTQKEFSKLVDEIKLKEKQNP